MPLLSSVLAGQDNDPIWRLALDGRLFVAGDADENDMVTGQTSFAATTPTFLLQVPSGTTCLPLSVDLSQSGTVAGGDITVVIEVDDIDRYSSGGTAETIFSPTKTSGPTSAPVARTPACVLYSNPTAAAG